jgi:hypothetical protein
MADRRAFFAAKTTNGAGDDLGWNGGRGSLVARGTWDGATITFSAADSSGAFIDLGSDAVLTADGIVNFDLPAGFTLRATVSGVGTSSLNAAVVGP